MILSKYPHQNILRVQERSSFVADSCARECTYYTLWLRHLLGLNPSGVMENELSSRLKGRPPEGATIAHFSYQKESTRSQLSRNPREVSCQGIHEKPVVKESTRSQLSRNPREASCQGIHEKSVVKESTRSQLSRNPREASCQGIHEKPVVKESTRSQLSRNPREASCQGIHEKSVVNATLSL